jgi:hypothetical protein
MSLVMWIVVAILALGALVSVATVGKPRKPMTGGAAALVVIIDAALIVAILWDRWGTVL